MHDPFLQVVAEEAVAGRMAHAGDRPPLGDPPGHIPEGDHLDVRPAIGPGGGQDPRGERLLDGRGQRGQAARVASRPS